MLNLKEENYVKIKDYLPIEKIYVYYIGGYIFLSNISYNSDRMNVIIYIKNFYSMNIICTQ